MNRISEVLHVPGSRYLRLGIATLAAVVAVNPDQVADPMPIDYPVAPRILEAPAAASQANQPWSSAGVTYEPAPAELDQAGMAEEQELQAGVPAIIRNFIEQNTVQVRIGDENCSGSLVRDSEGTPLGALMAAHCIDDGEAQLFNPLARGGDDNLYLVSPEPVTLARGIDTKNLQTVGNVEKFVIPPMGSNIDQAFAVLPGHTAKEVIANYNRRKLAAEDRKKLPPGEKIWAAGYPQYQDGDEAGNPIRHEFPTTFLAQTLIQVNGEYQQVLATVMKTDGNGAVCGWGMSGSEGLVIESVHPPEQPPRQVVRSVGDLSAAAQFRIIRDQHGNVVYAKEDARYAARWFHANYPGINMKNVDATCSFAFKPIKRGKRVSVYPVSSTDAIPAPVLPITK